MSRFAAVDEDTRRPEFLAILSLRPPVSEEDVKQAYLEKAKTAHPDRGGNPQAFIRLQQAYEQATEYARFKAGRREWLTRWVEQYAEQQRMADEIRAMGGEVDFESVDELAQSIGPDFGTVLDRLTTIRFQGAQINDSVLFELGKQKMLLAALRRLDLIGTKVTSLGLRELHACNGLQRLDLTGTRTTAASVKELLGKLPQLEKIVLRDTGIGWWSRAKLGFAHRGVIA